MDTWTDLENACHAIKHLDREMLDLEQIRFAMRNAQVDLEAISALRSCEHLEVTRIDEVDGGSSYRVVVRAVTDRDGRDALLQLLSR